MQVKYINKSVHGFIFGMMYGVNWNNHHKAWHRKYELVLEREKEKILYGGNVMASFNEKGYGMRYVKKMGKDFKGEVMVGRKWGMKDWGSCVFGVKINVNW